MTKQQPAHTAYQGGQANLRRLDWRFLLPTSGTSTPFRHLVLSGGPPGLAERARAVGLADAVNATLASQPRADAVILLHDSPITVEDAAAHLAPGGVLYQEVARPARLALATTPQRIRQRLQRAGLTLTGLYWAAPNFDQCRRYIPLDVPGALHWYFSSLFVAGSLLHRLLQSVVLRVGGDDATRVGWLLPHLCYTAIAGEVAHARPALFHEPAVAEVLPSQDYRPMLVTSGQDDASRLIMLPFAPTESRPAAVIKIATNANFNRETANEQRALQEVRAQLDPVMQQGVPEPWGVMHRGEMVVSVESCAPGLSLWASSGAWGASDARKIADVELGAGWLTRFHQQTTHAQVAWDQAAVMRWVERPLAAYAAVRTVTAAEQRLFTQVRTHAEALARADVPVNVPLVWQHHDFAPWNLFRDGDKLTVIDWEANREWESTRAGPPLCDLLYFATYWNNVAHHLYSDATELAGLHALFLADNPASPTLHAARRAIATYMAALDLDWRVLPVLLVYTWVERVVYSAGRAEKLGRSGASRAADKFARLVGVLAEDADALFAAAGDGFWQTHHRAAASLYVEATAQTELAP